MKTNESVALPIYNAMPEPAEEEEAKEEEAKVEVAKVAKVAKK
jgi:hypothetical protein